MPFENINTATSREKFLGIIEKVVAKKSYSAPLLLSNDAVEMNGRSFTVTKSDTTELKDYKRNADNEFDHAQTEERTYTLGQEKYWGRFVDRLDERDSNGEVNVNYVVARQAAEVVAPYLDHLRFDALLGNVSDNVVPANTKGANNSYQAVLDVSEKLDELDVVENRLLFVTPAFYKAIKSEIVNLPQGDTNQTVLYKGYVGQLDTFTVYKVPSKYLKGVQAVATIGGVVVSPIQVDETKYNNNIPGRFGELVEQLLYTGAFVFDFDQKYIISIATSKPEAKPSAQGELNIRAEQWVSGATYEAGARVQNEGKLFEATKKVNSSSTAPGSDSANWKEIV
ncbi:TPA: sugar-binding protein [Streptococcus suis]|nr:sugar-binding protein [Streptococcus suis]HEL1710373.1 sugar-binding protein [Streptococcus suis]HEL1972026.1 sugar-binding protein [Streptococcus suis]HEL2077198.1 sugar-binding protein [Streptococcus suis]